MCRMLVQLQAKSARGTLCSLPHPQTPFEDKFSLGPLPNVKGKKGKREGGKEQRKGGRKGESQEGSHQCVPRSKLSMAF